MIGFTNLNCPVFRRPLSVILSSGITDSVVNARVIVGEGTEEPSVAHAFFSSAICLATVSTDCIRKVEEYNATGCPCRNIYPLADDVHAMIDAFEAQSPRSLPP
jgi:hypothetical protein